MREHHRWRMKPNFKPGDPCYTDRPSSENTVTGLPEKLRGLKLMHIATSQARKEDGGILAGGGSISCQESSSQALSLETAGCFLVCLALSHSWRIQSTELPFSSLAKMVSRQNRACCSRRLSAVCCDCSRFALIAYFSQREFPRPQHSPLRLSLCPREPTLLNPFAC